MKIFIKKISFLFLSFALLLGACETEESIEITSPDPAFTLQTPSISSIFLNFSLPNNPAFTISWNDEITDGSSYTVEMSTDESFTAPMSLGTTSSNSFSMSVNDFNEAIRNAGVSNFVDIAVYMRIVSGNNMSNSILYLVTTYPTDAPAITDPSNGDSFVLSLGSIDDNALTLNWTDPVISSLLGVTVETSIDAAIAGTDFATSSPLGNVTNEETLSLTHGQLNEVALGLGLTPDNAADIDIRIVASISNTNGDTLTRTSATITVSVTPFNATFPFVYFVGDATTAGWNNNNNNAPLFRSQDTPNSYHFTGYFNAWSIQTFRSKRSMATSMGNK